MDVDARNDPFLVEYVRARDLLQGADWRQGLQEMEQLAHRGSIMSTLLVADAMRSGWMYDQDLPGAEAWYRVAVESGSARGLFGLGLTHWLQSRFSEAIQDLEAAIARSYPPAYNALANMCYRGKGMPVDKRRAATLWRKGASLGHLPSRRNLVQVSLHGEYGLWGRVFGMANLVPIALEISIVKATNRYTDRLR